MSNDYSIKRIKQDYLSWNIAYHLVSTLTSIMRADKVDLLQQLDSARF